MSFRFLAVYAARSLRRGGQRSLLAIVCIAFGVLALVAMQLLATVVGRATNVAPRLELGGDLEITGATSGLTDADIARLDAFVRDGILSAVTIQAVGEVGMVRSGGSGRVQLVGRVLAIDPHTYPLVGTVHLAQGGTLAAAVAAPRSVVLTRDLARQLDVVAGDTIRFGGVTREPVRLVVGGVAAAVPDRRGQTMMYGLETAELLDGRAALRRRASAVASDDVTAAREIAAAGMSVRRAAEETPGGMSRVFGLMLRGAGLLGLIIGGIGIAYTLQVMLTRRRMEIATLRAIGYRTRHLLFLFGAEAAVLGAVGGVLGAALAIAVSAQLVHLLDRTAGSLMLEYSLSPIHVATGPLVGTATAVLFGTAAILRACAVRPGVLLRDLPVRPTRGAAIGALGLHLLLAMVFVVLAGSVMRSLSAGLGVVAVAVAGVVVLGSVLITLLWLLVRIPLPHLPLLNMARANLRSRQVRSAFSLIALFVGVFSIGVAASALNSGRDAVAQRRPSDEGLNIRIYADGADASAVDDALRRHGATIVIAGWSSGVRSFDSAGARIGMPGDVEFHDPAGLERLVTTSDSTLRLGAGVALVPELLTQPPFTRRVGERLTLVRGTHTAEVVIAGTYVPLSSDFFSAPRGFLAGPDLARALGIGEAPTNFLAALPEDALDAAAPALGDLLPSSLVISKRDINDFLVATYQSLFMFVVAIAGLALVAGTVLIANAVSLAMVERRRELGVLMAIGYTSRRVLRTILLENGALGLVAGAAGIAGVRIVIAVLNARESALDLEFGISAAAGLMVTSVALAMSAAATVAWGPVHVRPLEVLRDE